MNLMSHRRCPRQLFRYLVAFIGLVAIGFGPVSSNSLAEDAWTSDAAAAIKKAKEEDKDLVFLFTGSDWCPPCKKLEAEILGTEDFQIEATTTLVLVKFDFPKEKRLDAKVIKQNKEYAKKYGVEGYPTVIFVGADLRPLGITGAQDGGIPNYLAMLEEFRQLRLKRDENLERAKTAKGLERAKLLDLAIGGIAPGIVQVYYPEIVKEIIELDKDDEAGLRTKYNEAKDAELRKIILTDIQMIAELETPENAIKFIDEVSAEIDFSPAQQLSIMQVKLNLIRKLNKIDEMDALLDEMINLEGVEGETKERLLVKKILLMVGTERRDEAMKLLDESFVAGENNLYLQLCKGQLLVTQKKLVEAITCFDKGIGVARSNPDMMVEFVGAKADALYEQEKQMEAVQLLDNFAEDKAFPSDLRSEAMLHKALIMRDMNRMRQARLAENRAVEIAESADERTEIQKMVERLRKRVEKQ